MTRAKMYIATSAFAFVAFLIIAAFSYQPDTGMTVGSFGTFCVYFILFNKEPEEVKRDDVERIS